MANSVTIEYALSGETVTQGFTASGMYVAATNNTRITVSLNGATKFRGFPATGETSQPWSIPFDAGTPSMATGDLTATIAGAGASGDTSEDVDVVGNLPLNPPIVTGDGGLIRALAAAEGDYTVSGEVNESTGVFVICMVQKLKEKVKQPRTLFCTGAPVINLKWVTRIHIPGPPGDNKFLVLRVLLVNKNSKVVGTISVVL